MVALSVVWCGVVWWLCGGSLSPAVDEVLKQRCPDEGRHDDASQVTQAGLRGSELAFPHIGDTDTLCATISQA